MTRRAAGWPLAFVGLLCVAAPAGTATTFTAGAAARELTPSRRVPLAGYSRRGGRPASGVHDAPMVRALVLRQGDLAVALASCDLLIIDETLFADVQRRLREAGFSGTLLMAATHTHSGPGAYGRKFFEKISMGHFDPAVFESLSSQISRAILEAAADLKPASIGAASIATDGLVKNRVRPDGPVDNQLRVAAVWTDGHDRGGPVIAGEGVSAAGGLPTSEPLAVVAGFAAHPTTLGAWNMEMSADYPGVLTRLVEARHPGAVCLFFAGAVGDQAPVKAGDGFARAERLGRPLGEQALALLKDLRPASGHLSSRQEIMPLPPPRVRLNRHTALPGWLSRRFVDDDATLTVIAAGPAVFIGAPCDLSVELGRQLQSHAAARGYTPFIVGFADDYIGYCVPPALYETGQYEALMAFNGPDTGLRIVSRLQQMLDELPPR